MKQKLTRFYRYIRSFLIFAIVVNSAITAYHLVFNRESGTEDVSLRLQLIFTATVTLIATFLPSYLDERTKIQLPEVLEVIVIVFVIAAGYLSQRYNLFVRFYWWDDLLHFTSGTFIAIAGLLLIYMLNQRYSFDLSPWLIAIFTFSFSVAVAVFWEIGEFFADSMWQTNYQKWDVPADTPLLGKSYQGLALRDTMADLIIASAGAMLIALLAFLSLTHRKEKMLNNIHDWLKRPKREEIKQK